jgi:hypothetical protein
MNLFFTDLDDTLFSSLRKHDDSGDLRPEAFLKSGEPICYSDARQRRLRALMSHGEALLIPVTARSVEAFSRSGVCGYGKAICANGAVMLNADGSHDRVWEDLVRDRLRDAQQQLLDFERACQRWVRQHDLRMWLVTEEGVGHIYCVIKSNGTNTDVLGNKAAQLRSAPPPWVGTIHLNGNNLAIIPAGVSKTQAVSHLRAELQAIYPESVSFGVGDSRSDWSFMSLCDFAVLPTRSQLASNIGSQLPELELC